MSNNSSSSSGGFGFLALLGVLFVGLKLGNVITWPWVWVLAPFWGAVAIWFGLLMLGFVLIGLAAYFHGAKS